MSKEQLEGKLREVVARYWEANPEAESLCIEIDSTYDSQMDDRPCTEIIFFDGEPE